MKQVYLYTMSKRKAKKKSTAFDLRALDIDSYVQISVFNFEWSQKVFIPAAERIDDHVVISAFR